MNKSLKSNNLIESFLLVVDPVKRTGDTLVSTIRAHQRHRLAIIGSRYDANRRRKDCFAYKTWKFL